MQFKMLGDEDIGKIHETALVILESIGMQVAGDEARGILLSAGAQEKNGRLLLDSRLIEQALSSVPQNGFEVAGRDRKVRYRIAPGTVRFRPAGGLPFVYDTVSKRRRPATLEDGRAIARLIDGLEDIDVANCAASPAEIGVGIHNVRRFAIAIEESIKPADITASGPDEVRTVAEIARLFRRDDKDLRDAPPVVVYVSPTSPMRLSEQEALATIECARQGLPLAPLSCPSLAATAPVTVAGAVAQEWAEELFQIVLAYAVRPGLPVVACNRINPVDMRRGNTVFYGAAPALSAAAFTEVARRFGLPANSWGFSSASHLPDLQAGAERMLGALVAALPGTAVISGAGALSSALITSAEQLVVDNEIAGLVRQTLQGVEVSSESLASEYLEDGIAEGTFLTSEHTLRMLQSGKLSMPEVFTLEPYETWAENPAELFDRAKSRVDQILGARQAPDPKLSQEIERILAAVGA